MICTKCHMGMKRNVNPDGTTDLLGYVVLGGPRHGFIPLEDGA
jgi:hypothetical protein